MMGHGHGMGNGYGYGMGTGGAWLMGLLLLAGIIVVVVVVVLALNGHLGHRGATPPANLATGPVPTSAARAILYDRYARGEIGTDEYAERLRGLGFVTAPTDVAPPAAPKPTS